MFGIGFASGVSAQKAAPMATHKPTRANALAAWDARCDRRVQGRVACGGLVGSAISAFSTGAVPLLWDGTPRQEDGKEGVSPLLADTIEAGVLKHNLDIV